MGIYKDLRDEIVTELQAIQIEGADAFQEVVTKPVGTFAGYPAAVVLPSEVMSDYITVAQNQRGYGFMVDIQVNLTHAAQWDEAVNNSMALIDAVLDRLDQTVDLNGKADFLKAVPVMGWSTVKETGGLVILPAIHVVAIKDVNV